MEAMSMGLKILTGHTCELADVSELDLNLSDRDPDFTAIARKFLLNLTHVIVKMSLESMPHVQDQETC